jgi:hypothetical protein
MAVDKELIKRRVLSAMVFTALFYVSVLSYPPAEAAGWRDFEASGIEYNVALNPRLSGRHFKSKVKFFKEGIVRVVEIKNFINGRKKPDINIKIAVSSNSAGSAIYDSEMKLIAEYPAGTIADENLYIFDREVDNTKITGRWFVDDDYLMSDFAIHTEEGVIVYQETVVYRAKKPLKKK